MITCQILEWYFREKVETVSISRLKMRIGTVEMAWGLLAGLKQFICDRISKNLNGRNGVGPACRIPTKIQGRGEKEEKGARKPPRGRVLGASRASHRIEESR